MKRNLFLILFAVIIMNGFAQKETFSKAYEENIYIPVFFRGNMPQIDGQYERSLAQCLSDLQTTHSPYNLFHVAVNYAQLGMKDSVFYYLDQFVDISFDDRVLFLDSAFLFLQEEKEWTVLKEKIELLYLQSLPSSVNRNLSIELFYLNMLCYQHQYYFLIDHTITAKQYNKQEDLVLNTLNNIINKYGVPTIKNAGVFGEKTVFYALRKSYLSKQYYQSIRKMYKANEIAPPIYAIVTDQWLIHKGKKQLYGTQTTRYIDAETEKFTDPIFIFSIKDISTVNERRREMGFTETLEEYMQSNSYLFHEKVK